MGSLQRPVLAFMSVGCLAPKTSQNNLPVSITDRVLAIGHYLRAIRVGSKSMKKEWRAQAWRSLGLDTEVSISIIYTTSF